MLKNKIDEMNKGGARKIHLCKISYAYNLWSLQNMVPLIRGTKNAYPNEVKQIS